MNPNSALDCFLNFMWYGFSYSTCLKLIRGLLGHEVFVKWARCVEKCGIEAAPAKFYAELDECDRQAIVKAAKEYYNPK